MELKTGKSEKQEIGDAESGRGVRDALDKSMVEAENASMARLEFMSSMTDEIRNPLNIIIASLEILEKSSPISDQSGYISEAKSAADALFHIINDILDFSQIESGSMVVSYVTFNLRVVVEDAVMISAPKAQAKGIGLNVLVFSDVPVYVSGDPAKLKQVINNLVSNGVSFTSGGEVTVYVKRDGEIDEEGRVPVKFDVVDTGTGISEEAQAGLFRPFPQNGVSAADKYRGAGLGLAICKKIVDAMGGDIGVSSIVGKGSVFSFALRFDEQRIEEYRHTEAASSNMIGRRVVVVDDSMTSRSVVRRYLEDIGCIVHDFEDAREAVSFMAEECGADQEAISCAIIEFALKGRSGIEVAREIKSTDIIRDIPLILLTSAGRKGDSQIAKEAGFGGYLAKPVRYSELIECVRIVTENDPAFGGKLVTKYTAKERRYETRKKILVIDGDEASQKQLSGLFSSLGLGTDNASGLEAGLEAVRSRLYDLIFIDSIKPAEDGATLARTIKYIEDEEKYPYKSLIVTISNVENRVGKEGCVAGGFDESLSKPVKLEDLKGVLDKYIGSVSVERKADVPMFDTKIL